MSHYLGDSESWGISNPSLSLSMPASTATGQVGVAPYIGTGSGAGLDLSITPSSSLNYLNAATTGLTTIGNIVAQITNLQTAKTNAKTANEVAAINSNIAQIQSQAGLTEAQVAAEQAKQKSKTTMILIGGGIAVAALVGVALMMKG
jgi:hypothetical protein